MDDAELVDLEAKAVAMLRGLVSGTAAVRVKRTTLSPEAGGATVWDITLVQAPSE